ncbi:MAG: hypothetical protein DMG16_02370 [Acidobacteria bacterium]|nr:MAG: hypothetical protein DMG16_02370 [Acidobacteriota bacterium]
MSSDYPDPLPKQPLFVMPGPRGFAQKPARGGGVFGALSDRKIRKVGIHSGVQFRQQFKRDLQVQAGRYRLFAEGIHDLAGKIE